MLAARVEQKNAPLRSKKSGNFIPLVFGDFRTAVDTTIGASCCLSLGAWTTKAASTNMASRAASLASYSACLQIPAHCGQ